MHNQSCWVCWVGLDIDDVTDAGPVIAALGEPWSVRKSHSGNGLHALARLETPLFCTHAQSGTVVKQITASHVARLATAGIEVCKADCRVMWLEGGKQEWMRKDEGWLRPQIAAPTSPKEAARGRPVVDLSALKPGIAEWAKRFIDAGVIRSLQPGQSCYLKDAVEVIKAAGETAPTRSSLRAKSGGFIDIRADHIQLWAHADGGVIWSYEEPDL
jgi:hypothetical protein